MNLLALNIAAHLESLPDAKEPGYRSLEKGEFGRLCLMADAAVCNKARVGDGRKHYQELFLAELANYIAVSTRRFISENELEARVTNYSRNDQPTFARIKAEWPEEEKDYDFQIESGAKTLRKVAKECAGALNGIGRTPATGRQRPDGTIAFDRNVAKGELVQVEITSTVKPWHCVVGVDPGVADATGYTYWSISPDGSLKSVNPPAIPLIDGWTPEQCLVRYSENMRSEKPEWLLSDKQKEKAREMWSIALRAKVEVSKAIDASRAARVIVDRDLDEVE